jgi:hypothetical protein
VDAMLLVGGYSGKLADAITLAASAAGNGNCNGKCD